MYGGLLNPIYVIFIRAKISRSGLGVSRFKTMYF
jgi:hypothetical protein